MQQTRTAVAATESDQDAKLRALRRTKAVATTALALCVAVFATAKALEGRHPWLGFVAAFAEAAAIGGIADWYAVVALFRRPLGLPIPHTAIIPANQGRIADNLGRFIEVNFLAPGPVREKLEEVDFSALVADWLADERRAEGLSRFVARLAPQMLSAIGQSGLRDFISARMLEQVEKVQVAPLAAELLTAFTDDRRHQKLFDQLLKVLGRFLSDEQALASLREKIHEELPSLFNLFRADAYLLKKIVASAAALLEEAGGDPDHPLRKEFDLFVATFIERLKTSKAYARRVEKLKENLLARPEIRDLARDMWKSLGLFLEQDLALSDSTVRAHLTGLLVEAGRHLSGDARIRKDMNQGFVVALSAFVQGQKSGVSKFIADQVKRWDLAQLTRLIEVNIGRDLQYIRFNGMLIGGLAGLALYGIERLFLGG